MHRATPARRLRRCPARLRGTRALGLPARASSDSPSYFAFVEQRPGECKTVAGESSEWLVDSLGIRRDDQSLLSSAFSRYRLPKRPQMLWLSSSARFAFARESSEVSPTSDADTLLQAECDMNMCRTFAAAVLVASLFCLTSPATAASLACTVPTSVALNVLPAGCAAVLTNGPITFTGVHGSNGDTHNVGIDSPDVGHEHRSIVRPGVAPGHRSRHYRRHQHSVSRISPTISKPRPTTPPTWLIRDRTRSLLLISSMTSGEASSSS